MYCAFNCSDIDFVFFLTKQCEIMSWGFLSAMTTIKMQFVGISYYKSREVMNLCFCIWIENQHIYVRTFCGV